MKTLKTLAAEVSAMFDRKTRNNGDEFWCLKDGAPQWVTDMCKAAHGDMMPDDYRYEFIVEALDALAENEDPDDITLEADIYNRDLTAWLASNLERAGYVDAAVQDFGLDTKSFEIFKVISLGQYVEKQEVLSSVRGCLEDRISAEVA